MIDALLQPLFHIINQLYSEYVALRKKGFEEESLVNKSALFAKSAKKMINNVSSELTKAVQIIHNNDIFFMHMISLLEKNGFIVKKDIPKEFLLETPNYKSAESPRKLDSQSRQRICSLIRVGVTKLLNKKIISFFQETNDFAENVASSPPPSPSRSEGRGANNKSVKPRNIEIGEDKMCGKFFSFMSDITTDAEDLERASFPSTSSLSRRDPVRSLSSNSLIELAALSEEELAGVPFKS